MALPLGSRERVASYSDVALLAVLLPFGLRCHKRQHRPIP